MYYPLHVHTTIGSVGDSILKIDDYVEKAVEYGLDALAITDHGSMSAMYSFAKACQEHNIKPIIGMEAYVVDNNNLDYQKEHKYKKGAACHLVLLAKNQEGFENLLRIHNQAATEGYYYEARTDWEHLKKWGKGIIASSACVGGEIPQCILTDKIDTAKELARFYDSIFDEFYLEIQPGEFDAQEKVNRALVKMSRELNIPITVTNDIHYLTANDAIRHDYHVKLDRHSYDDDKMIYPDTCYWFMNEEALKEAFVYENVEDASIVNEALKNAEHIAHECNVTLDTTLHMPKFPAKDGETEEELLYKKCYKSLEKIIENKPNPQEYIDRLNYELDIIQKKGFCGYFLVVQDYINWAREHDIAVGPGRGSAAGSLVSYALGISQPDPIKYGLMFERFLSPHRAAVPDIDTDMMPGVNGRDRMFDYMVERYGYNHCALVSTLGFRKAKSAVRDAARVLGYAPAVGNELAKLIPDVYYGDDGSKKTDLDIKSSIEVVPELKNKYKHQYKDILDLAASLEGFPSSSGLHAAGILLSPFDMTNAIPLIKSNKENVLATSLNLEDAENLCIKYDFLALATLSVMQKVEKEVGWKFDYQDDILLEDAPTWDLIGSRNTTGVFQLASKTYKDRMPRLKPRTIQELAACLALVRGPCISNKTDELYIDIVEGKKEIVKIHPLYDEVTKETNGVLIYQEQIIKLIEAFGFPLSVGYDVMKMAQKKKTAKLKEFAPKFIEQAFKMECNENTANRIFDKIVDAGQYSFNHSHAVSYAMVSYASAYLKVHYPLEYACALLTNTYQRSKDKEYSMVYEDCRRQGIQFLPLDMRKSEWEFTIEDSKIRIGLCAIKGFGEKAADVTEELKNQEYTSIEELLEVINDNGYGRIFNKKVMTVAIFSGLLDFLRDEGMERRDLYIQYMEERKEKEIPEDISLGAKDFAFSINDTEDQLELLFLNNPFVYDPVNELESFGWDEILVNRTFDAEGYIRKVKKIKTRKGDAMAYLTVGTGDGDIEATVFPRTYNEYHTYLKAKKFISFRGKKEDMNSCILNSLND